MTSTSTDPCCQTAKVTLVCQKVKQHEKGHIKKRSFYMAIQFWPSCIARRTFSLRPEEAHSSEQKLVFQLKKLFCLKRKLSLHEKVIYFKT